MPSAVWQAYQPVLGGSAIVALVDLPPIPDRQVEQPASEGPDVILVTRRLKMISALSRSATPPLGTPRWREPAPPAADASSLTWGVGLFSG